MPTRASWTSPWHAGSKRSNILLGSSGGCAEPAPQNIAKTFCATMRGVLWGLALMKQGLFVALPRLTASNTPRVLSCCDIGFPRLKNKRSIPFVHRLATSLTRKNFLEIRPKRTHSDTTQSH